MTSSRASRPVLPGWMLPQTARETGRQETGRKHGEAVESSSCTTLSLCAPTTEEGYNHLHLLRKSRLHEGTNDYLPIVVFFNVCFY